MTCWDDPWTLQVDEASSARIPSKYQDDQYSARSPAIPSARSPSARADEFMEPSKPPPIHPNVASSNPLPSSQLAAALAASGQCASLNKEQSSDGVNCSSSWALLEMTVLLQLRRHWLVNQANPISYNFQPMNSMQHNESAYMIYAYIYVCSIFSVWFCDLTRGCNSGTACYSCFAF